MTDVLAAIRARLQAATPGPWYCLLYHEAIFEPSGGAWLCQFFDKTETDLPNYENNAEFIAHALEDIAALLTEVERLRAELTAERQRCETLEEKLSEVRSSRVSAWEALERVTGERDWLFERMKVLERALPDAELLERAAEYAGRHSSLALFDRLRAAARIREVQEIRSTEQ